jgi:peroxin-2
MGQVNAEASSSRIPLAPKVAQVDADELDEGLVQMLGERVEKAVGNFKVPPFPSAKYDCRLIISLIGLGI